MGRHARNDYVVAEGEKFRIYSRDKASSDLMLPLGEFQRANRTYVYSHIFDVQDEKAIASIESCESLAAALALKPYRPAGDGDIPSGYTYLGQFIFHDITYMRPGKIPTCPASINSPVLDLDSVLPTDGGFAASAGCLDTGPLPLGCTFGGVPLPEDLPRVPMFSQGEGRPIIEDDRNDDFLPLAQCHLIILKFFNAIAANEGYDHATGRPPRIGWDGVRRTWLQHFQSVVLHDYLPRVVDRWTYLDVMRHGRRIVHAGRFANTEHWFPLEFAGAVGRFGHSMIRHDYEPWNRLLNNIETPVTKFMEFSYVNSGNGLIVFDRRLPTNWITNWHRLFDFSGTPYHLNAGATKMAGLIDTNLAPALACLPKCILDDICTPYSHDECTPYSHDTLVLANETLRRGWTLRLASGQHALAVLNGILPTPLQAIPEDELPGSAGPVQEAFDAHRELFCKTPLWFYILREAEYFAAGCHLGPLGSRIVMETLHAAIDASTESIFHDAGWRPQLPCADHVHFKMPDLIAFTGDPNPLGD